MPFVFILVVGILLGFMLYAILKQWIKGCEAAQRARIAREDRERMMTETVEDLEDPKPRRRRKS